MTAPVVAWLGWYSTVRWWRTKRVLVLQHAFADYGNAPSVSICGSARVSEYRPAKPAPKAPKCMRCVRLTTRRKRLKRALDMKTAFKEAGGG